LQGLSIPLTRASASAFAVGYEVASAWASARSRCCGERRAVRGVSGHILNPHLPGGLGGISNGSYVGVARRIARRRQLCDRISAGSGMRGGGHHHGRCKE